MKLMTFKGYLGSIEFDEEERIFYGRLAFIRALVSYEAGDAEGLVRAFHEAVDDYLGHCKETGTPPSGRSGELQRPHRGRNCNRRAVVASRAGMSLNASVTRALETAVAAEIEEQPSK